MSTFIHVECDGPECGMRTEAQRLDELSASDFHALGATGLTLRQKGAHDLHFCSITCLERWAAWQEAKDVAPPSPPPPAPPSPYLARDEETQPA